MGTRQTVLVIVPRKPALHQAIRDRNDGAIRNMIQARGNAELDFAVLLDQRPAPPVGQVRTPWTKVAAVRNRLCDEICLEAFDYVLWIDSDVVGFPPELPALLIESNPQGISAPMVLIEGTQRFYDWAAFLEEGSSHLAPRDPHLIPGRNLSDQPPYWFNGTPATDIVAMDCVGTIVCVPGRLYAAISGRAPYEDHYSFTDHFSICRFWRLEGHKVTVDRRLVAGHADLPLYGESWHPHPGVT
jgi:hypothetical protein